MIVYRSFFEAIKELPKENQADVWNTIFEFSLNFNEIELTGINKTIFTLIRPQLEANIKRFKSGSKTRASSKQTRSKAEAKRKQNRSKTEANLNLNLNPNLNPNLNENVNLNETPPDFKNPRFKKPTLEEVTTYCTERKNTVNPQLFLDHYNSNGWRVGKTKMVDWEAAIRTWEKNNYNTEKKESDVFDTIRKNLTENGKV